MDIEWTISHLPKALGNVVEMHERMAPHARSGSITWNKADYDRLSKAVDALCQKHGRERSDPLMLAGVEVRRHVE